MWLKIKLNRKKVKPKKKSESPIEKLKRNYPKVKPRKKYA